MEVGREGLMEGMGERKGERKGERWVIWRESPRQGWTLSIS